MTANDRDPSVNPEDAALEHMEPVDPDIMSIPDYLARALSTEDSAGVEQRLRDDTVFFEKVLPIMRVWQMPSAVARRRARAQAEMEARAEAGPSSTAPEQSVRPYDVAPPPPRHVSEPAPTYTPDRIKRARPVWPRRHPALTFIAASIIFFAQPATNIASYSANAITAGTLGQLDTHAPSPIVGGYVETRQKETHTVTLPGGSTIEMREMSRVTYKPADSWFGGVTATLKGEAVIRVTKADKRIYLGTMSGAAVLFPGVYAIRCELGCTIMRVTVGSVGRAWVKSFTATSWLLPPLHENEHGESRPPHDPSRTSGYQYPEVK